MAIQKAKFDIFDKRHNVGDVGKLRTDIILLVTELSNYLNDLYGFTDILVTSGYRANDPSSQHKEGCALDIVCLNPKIRLIDFYLAAERFAFTGIGVYPDWKANGRDTGGLHVDTRKLDNKFGARWMGMRSLLTGKNEYIGLTSDNLRKYNVI